MRTIEGLTAAERAHYDDEHGYVKLPGFAGHGVCERMLERVVGVSLAITPATTSNGCLHVLPGSHRDPMHTHVPDRRPGANVGYVEIVDRDVSGAVATPMDPGDLLVFDGHIVHRSRDNVTDGLRAAMTYHFAATGTRDLHPGLVNDFVTVR